MSDAHEMIPVIETERLVLRGWREDEFERAAEIYADPEGTRFIGGPRSWSASWDAYLRNLGCWVAFGYGGWAVIDRDSGRGLGQVGFQMRRRGLGADFEAAPECGWVLAPEAQGRGLGREAAAAVHRWFDAQEFGGRSHVVIDRGHVASCALAERLGYRGWREARYEGDACVLMARMRGAGEL